ncbi:MAG: MFS transporter [Gemmataceae bacterium]|nr:MFS transporter [Gemmataceae bacterium]
MSEAENPVTTGAGEDRKSARLLMFVIVFIDLLGFGIVLPLLPAYADKYLEPLLGEKNNLSGLVLGLLMSSFSLMQFLFAPAWGRLSDRIGRRPVLLVGLAGSVVAYGIFGIASDLSPGSAALAVGLLFLSRAGAGIAGATISTAQAVIADCTPPEKRKLGMALIGAAFGIGFTFGPILGFLALLLFPDRLGITGWMASGLSAVALVLAIFRLPETRRPGGPPSSRKLFDAAAFSKVLKDPAVGPVVLVSFLSTLGFGGFESTLALLNKDVMGLVEKYNFLVFASIGLVLAFTNGAYRGMAKRVPEEKAMALGITLMGIGVALLALVVGLHRANQDWYFKMAVLIPSLVLAVVGYALLTPSVQSLVSRRSEDHRQGEVLGVNQSCSAMARILGPLTALSLYKLDALLPFVLGGMVVLCMLPLMPRIRQGGQQTRQTGEAS